MNSEHGLREFFSRYPSPAQPRSQPRFLGNAGGLSGVSLWRFDSELGPLVARRWPAGFGDPARLERVHDWLGFEADLGVVPIPIKNLEGRSVVRCDGHLWELDPWQSGMPELVPADHPERVEAAFLTLARFHQRLESNPSARLGESPGLRRRLVELEQLIRSDFDRLEAAVRHQAGETIRDLARRWLQLARQLAPAILERLRSFVSKSVRLQPCIRDARREHFLFEGSRLSGIIDFGAMDVESAVGDIARLISDWLYEDRTGTLRRLSLATYEQVRPLDPVERALLPIFEQSSLVLGPSHWIRWAIVEQRDFDSPQAVENGLGMSLTRLEHFVKDRIDQDHSA